MEISEIKDGILLALKNAPDPFYGLKPEEIRSQLNPIDESDFYSVVEVLFETKFIETGGPETGFSPSYLTITPKGKSKLLDGGFIKDQERQEKEAIRIHKNDLITRISVGVAVIAVSWGIYKDINTESNDKTIAEIDSIKLNVSRLQSTIDSLSFKKNTKATVENTLIDKRQPISTAVNKAPIIK